MTSIILGQQSSIRFVFFWKEISYGMVDMKIVCMNYIYICIPNFLGYWYYLDIRGMSYKVEEICPFQSIYGIGNVKLETMCLDSLIERTFSRKSLRHELMFLLLKDYV
jgi:hypothetical protein